MSDKSNVDADFDFTDARCQEQACDTDTETEEFEFASETDNGDDDDDGEGDAQQESNTQTEEKKPDTDHKISDEDEEDYGFVEDEEPIETAIFDLHNRYQFTRRIHVHSEVGVYHAFVKDKTTGKSTDQEVAVKIVMKHGKVRLPHHIPIEVRILSQLRGLDGFQQIIDYHSFENTYVIVSHLEKESSFSRSLFYNDRDILLLIKQLLAMYTKLHSMNIIYRDSKCSNLLWNDATKRLVLCDFDLATFTTRHHILALGTEGFIAPEILPAKRRPITEKQVKKLCKYDEKVDAYGAGAILGSLLFRERENEMDDDSVKKWRKNLQKKAKRKKLSVVEDVFLTLTTFDPKKRASCEDALAMLNATETEVTPNQEVSTNL